MGLVTRLTYEYGWALKLGMVLHQHAVVQYSDISRCNDLLALKRGCGENDIVSLPLRGRAHRVY